MAHSETTAPAARQATAPESRVALALQVLDLLRRAFPADSGLELAMADDAGAEPPQTPARIIVGGPDALARPLWPPSADALGEAYLRGDGTPCPGPIG